MVGRRWFRFANLVLPVPQGFFRLMPVGCFNGICISSSALILVGVHSVLLGFHPMSILL